MRVALKTVVDTDFILDRALRCRLSENLECESFTFFWVLTVERTGLVNRGLRTFTIALDNLVFGGLLTQWEH